MDPSINFPTLHERLERLPNEADRSLGIDVIGCLEARARGNSLEALQRWHQLTQRNKVLSAELAGLLGYNSAEEWRAEVQRFNRLKAEFIRDHYADIRTTFGAKALFRVDRAVAGYLGEASVFPSHPHQKPKFLYIPGLPDTGFHDAKQHPCTAPLLSASDQMRAEFLSYQDYAQKDPAYALQPYMELRAGHQMSEFVGGSNPKASWDAIFFYRHGQRFDLNHERCPITSQLLEQLPLIRIEGQTPEICFSVMQPGTIIREHYGVSNVRLVLHIPLIIPDGSYLELKGIGRQHWKQGEALLFDDTFLHAAYNPSDQQRVILLMDVWNHHLRDPEKAALKSLIECISMIEQNHKLQE